MGQTIDVWCASTNIRVDGRILSPDEILRASQFRFERDRCSWMAARSFLRRVLSGYLDIAPSEVRFTYSEFGKPAVAGFELAFNLSHSGDLAVCAVGGKDEIGIDVEKVRPIDDIESLFSCVSSQREFRTFHAVPPPYRMSYFFNVWTVKEACIKAEGTGLSTPLSQIEVLPSGGACRRVVSGARRWSVYSFSPEDGYVAALAVRTHSIGPVPGNGGSDADDMSPSSNGRTTPIRWCGVLRHPSSGATSGTDDG